MGWIDSLLKKHTGYRDYFSSQGCLQMAIISDEEESSGYNFLAGLEPIGFGYLVCVADRADQVRPNKQSFSTYYLGEGVQGGPMAVSQDKEEKCIMENDYRLHNAKNKKVVPLISAAVSKTTLLRKCLKWQGGSCCIRYCSDFFFSSS